LTPPPTRALRALPPSTRHRPFQSASPSTCLTDLAARARAEHRPSSKEDQNRDPPISRSHADCFLPVSRGSTHTLASLQKPVSLVLPRAEHHLLHHTRLPLSDIRKLTMRPIRASRPPWNLVGLEHHTAGRNYALDCLSLTYKVMSLFFLPHLLGKHDTFLNFLYFSE
jgi:hypothetical protein